MLFWLSIVLPSLGAVAAGARYYVDRQEKRISSEATANAIKSVTTDASTALADAQRAREAQADMARTLAQSQHELAELRKKAAPRQLSESQRQAMLSHLVSIKGQTIAVACRMMDGESCDFARDLMSVLQHAGCNVPALITTSLNDLIGEVALVEVDSVDKYIPPTVTTALQVAGLKITRERLAQNSVGMWYPATLHIVVGRKAP